MRKAWLTAASGIGQQYCHEWQFRYSPDGYRSSSSASLRRVEWPSPEPNYRRVKYY
ncbi:MAG TPA: hypothetical protein VJ124_21720 [Pyrinomonadaceae bacterium]|nr:hypothetical protein [Pyrinomonadaceae bacterium]